MENRHESKISCASLLVYGKSTHERFHGICQYCGLGEDGVDFNLWRQLSVDHVIPDRMFPEGGKNLNSIFPKMPKEQLKNLSERINAINLVTACNFCNSMTSRMGESDGILIDKVRIILPSNGCENVTSINDELVRQMLQRLKEYVDELLPIKKAYAQYKLQNLRSVFERQVRPHLQHECSHHA